VQIGYILESQFLQFFSNLFTVKTYRTMDNYGKLFATYPKNAASHNGIPVGSKSFSPRDSGLMILNGFEKTT
ncbi:MAG: hypothetical protein AAFQ83_23750, partial [Bacteroidota bacterium]